MSIKCTTVEEPLCISGHDHAWKSETFLERVNDMIYPAILWRCQHCNWHHVIKHSEDSFYKYVPISFRIDYPEATA